ncbi:MAG: MFS transporter [Inquilinus sp.]|nr:MFS transporter [Inquilinus sp.]
MTRQLLPIAALLTGAAFLFLAGGVHMRLRPVRGGLEGFLPSQIGLLGTGWAAGFIAGCLTVPLMVQRVGHIRTFGVMAATAAISVLLNLLLIDAFVWIALRALSGFCFAGAMMIMESWLNERSTNRTRGTVFAIYMTINLGASTTGQMLIAAGDPGGLFFFVLAAILFCMALVPTALSTAAAPRPLVSTRIRLGPLYANSPVAVIGCFSIGMANGAFGTMGAVYGQQIGLPVAAIALLIATAVLGGALGQLPLGRFSDHTDRRLVIAATGVAAAAVGTSFFAFDPRDATRVIGMAAIYGVFAYPLYSLCVAHANDFADPERFVEISSGLILVYGFGTMVGPLASAGMMEWVAPRALFAFTAGVHLWIAGYALYRKMKRAPVPTEQRDAYESMPLPRATTPETAALDPRAERDEKAA